MCVFYILQLDRYCDVSLYNYNFQYIIILQFIHYRRIAAEMLIVSNLELSCDSHPYCAQALIINQKPFPNMFFKNNLRQSCLVSLYKVKKQQQLNSNNNNNL